MASRIDDLCVCAQGMAVAGADPRSVILTFPGGVRVWDGWAGEVVQEFKDEPLRVFRGRLVPVRDKAVVYNAMKAHWVRGQLAIMPKLSASSGPSAGG